MSEAQAEKQKVDIAIIGGGIVGLSCALSLRLLLAPALKIVLVDTQDKIDDLDSLKSDATPYDSRVSALTVASEKLFSNLGVWEDISEFRACPYNEMYVWDSAGTSSIQFSAADIQERRLGHIVENRVVVAALNKALNDANNIEIIRPDMVTSIHFSEDESTPHDLVLESGRHLSSPLVIGADGGNSFIRSQANFKTKEWDYEHQALVCTVKTEKPHQHTATQCFTPSGPLAFLPLQDANKEQCYSSIVWSCVPEQAEQLMALDDQGFIKALGEAFEYRLGKIVGVEPRVSFPLWQKHATDYVQEGIALIGDAAHTIHPLAGQGVNLGLMDVVSLTKVIVKAVEQGENFSSHQTLSRYQRQRKGPNLGMMAAMEGFKRLFASDDLALRWLRNTGVSGVDSLPLLKNHLMKKAMGL